MQRLLRIGILQYITNTSLDPDAKAFLTAAEITDPTISSAVNTLVLDLKAEGVWTKMLAIYPFVGGTASTHKWNLKNPEDTNAAFRLTFFGGVTHSASGIQGNGTNAYADTHLSLLNRLSRTGLSTYILNNVAQNSSAIRVFYTFGGRGTFIIPRWTDNNIFSRNFSNTSSAISNTDSRGFIANTRTSDTETIINVKGTNNTREVGISGSPDTATDFSVYIMAGNDSGTTVSYSTFQIAFSSIHDNMSGDDLTSLYNAVTEFQITLGRNV